MSKAILTSTLYDCTTNHSQWLFDKAFLLDRDTFLHHHPSDSWGFGPGFTARPYEDLWEILCSACVHKTQVTIEFLTNFVATLPEGTKISIGGFKNV